MGAVVSTTDAHSKFTSLGQFRKEKTIMNICLCLSSLSNGNFFSSKVRESNADLMNSRVTMVCVSPWITFVMVMLIAQILLTRATVVCIPRHYNIFDKYCTSGIFVCLYFRKFLILGLFTKFRIRKFFFFFNSAIIIIIFAVFLNS